MLKDHTEMCGPFITPIYYRGILLIVFIAGKYIGDKKTGDKTI